MKFLWFEITLDEIKGIWELFGEAGRRLVVPKVKRGRVGIIIAIQTEENQEKIRLQRDLIGELNNSLQHSELSQVFHVIQFPQSLSSKIDSPQAAKKYVWRSRGHFIVYGDLVQRNVAGTTNFVFRLNGLVVHRPIPQAVSNKLGKEFREFLPQKFMFPRTDELLGFEFSRVWLGNVAKYVIGIASMLSGDFDLATRLFISLEQELPKDKIHSENPIQEEFNKRLKVRIIEVLRANLLRQYNQFTHTRDRRFILESVKFTESLLKRNPDDYQGHLIQAMIHFFNGRINEAINTLADIKNNNDVTWRYSLGFLYAFKGDVDLALEQYRRAFYGNVGTNVVGDTEVFITEIMRENPALHQLLFFRGLINYKAKPDYALAKSDFEHFLATRGAEKLPRLTELANKYLSEIKLHIGV
jgi:tetratricopeptide (TPR) repeat protein